MIAEQKLIEEMAEVVSSRTKYFDVKFLAQDMLSVVKRNIGVVAMVCPECRGYGNVDTIGYGGVGEQEKCSNCHGTGVVRTGGE